jgi:DNA replication and repair protein RecF
VIDWVSLEHFRNISQARIEANGASLGIVGPNGSGKTSVLEALYVLGHGRSFRTAQRASVICRSAGVSRIVCALQPPDNARLGVEVSPSRLELRMGGQKSTINQVASRLPLQLVDPSVHLLVEEGSARRRKLLDWGVFHVEPRFGDVWRTYHRAVHQRNAALRVQSWDLVDAMSAQLVALGQELDEMRARHFEQLLPAFDEIKVELLDEPIALEYYRGWSDGISLGAAVETAKDKDRRLRLSTVGPHRADLRLQAQSGAAREVVSRGQQKLLASALVLSQARYLASVLGRKAVLLLDDPAAELDVDNLGKLMRAIRKTPAQVVATSLAIEGLDGLQLERLFHVKQGHVTPML